MKYILILLIFIGGYYMSYGELPFKPSIEVKTHHDIYKKLEDSSVTLDEILVGFREFSTSLCHDQSLQSDIGRTIDSCLHNLETYSAACADRILGSEGDLFSDKGVVDSLSKRYISCVGAADT